MLGVAPSQVGRPNTDAVTTQLVTDVAAFVRLEPEWNDAVRRAGLAHPFLVHEWLRTWWECFGAGRGLHLVIAREAGRIVGIAPLLIDQVHMYGLPVRRLDVLHNDHTPRADWIVASSRPQIYEALWSAILASGDHWDLLQLSRFTDDSPTSAAIRLLAHRDGCLTGTWRGDVSPYLDLSVGWERYWASRSAKFRSNLRNRLARLSRFGEARLEVLDDADADAHADAFRLEASGWKADSRTSISSTAAVQRFYTLLASRAARSGWLRLMFLTVGGRRIATSYSACVDNTLFLIKTGYDPEFAGCAPFKLLTYFAIQHACAEGLGEVDFLGDAEPWKLEWTETSRPHDWLFVFANSMRARLLHSLKFQVLPELKRWRA